MAFISYSHSDNREESRKWADWLHQALETYEIPAELVGRPNQAGQPIPRQIYPVFQDEKELSASADLSTALQAALARSQHLVFLSSPRSAASPYVIQELTFFKQLGRGSNIIALILAGDPVQAEGGSPLQCFPEALRYHIDGEGHIDKNRPEEPLAADVRLPGGPDQGFTTPEAYRRFLLQQGHGNKKELESLVQQYKNRLELAKLKIIAGILQVPLGELTKRDQAYQMEKMRQKNRMIKRIAAVIGFLAIAAALAGIFAWKQRNQAQAMLARSLYLSGQGQMERGQIADAAAYMAAATRLGGKSAAMFAQSLLLQTATETPLPQLHSDIVFSADASLLAGITATSNSSEEIELWNPAQGKKLRSITGPGLGKTPAIAFDDAQRLWILTSNGDIYRLGSEAEPQLIRKNIKKALYSNLKVNDDGSWLALQRQFAPAGNSPADAPPGDPELVLIPTATASQGEAEFALPTLSMERLASDGIFFMPTAAVQYARDRLSNTTRFAVYPLEGTSLGQARQSYVDITLPRLTPSPGGQHLLFWDNSTAFLLDLASKDAPQQLETGTSIEQAAFNPDGRTLALIRNDGISLFDTGSARLIKKEKMRIDRHILAALFPENNAAPDGIHSIALVQGQAVLNAQSVPALVEAQLDFGAHVAQVRSGQDSRYLFLKRSQASNIERWQVQGGVREEAFVRSDAPIERWDILKQANLLYLVAADRKLRFFNTQDGAAIGRPIQLHSLSFSVDQSERQCIARQSDTSLGIWDIASGAQLASIPFPGAEAKFMPAPDFKQMLLLHPDGSWQIKAMQDGAILHQGEGKLLSARFTDDSRFFLAFTSNSAEVFTTSGYRKLFTIPSTGENPIGDISPDGTMIALADSSNQVRLWDVQQQEAVGQPIPLDPISKFFRFSADGRRIITTRQATKSTETGVLFYDTASGLPLTVPLALDNRLNSLLIPADESSLITVGFSPESTMAVVWAMPDAVMSKPAELAGDLERLYGKAYAPETGAINNLLLEQKLPEREQPESWYFQSPYSRSVTPQSDRRVTDFLSAHVPIRDESGLRILSSLWSNHPMARAALAEYYSRNQSTAFLAQALLDMTRLQIAALPPAACPAVCQDLLGQSAANLEPSKEP